MLSDAATLTLSDAQQSRRSESGFLAEVARDRAHLFPHLPCQSEANRRIRWLRGAFGQLQAMLAARLPGDDCQQIDTTALPVKHTSRVRGPDGWTGPGNDLAARYGRVAAHAEWFYGFRLAVRTDLGSRIMRAWSIVPAAVNEREVAEDLLEAGPAPRDCSRTRASTAGPSPPARPLMAPPSWPPRTGNSAPLCPLACADHRRMAQLDRDDLQRDHRSHGTSPHGAHTFWDPLTRTAATIAARTLLLLYLTQA